GVGGSQARRRPRPQRRDGPVSAPTGTQDHERVPRSPGAYLRWLSGQVGPSGLKPVLVLLTLSAVERFGITIIAVLGPNIRDTFPPAALGTTFTFYLFATTAIALLAGPIGGGIGQVAGWRTAFAVMSVPTLVGVWLLGQIKDPGRGASIGLSIEREERSNFW